MQIQIDFFQGLADTKTVAAGETIFRAGDPGDVMYGIREGEIDIYIENYVLETAGPGGILGEMALIDHRPRCATVIARTDCKLVPINEADFLFKVQHNPLFALFVMQASVRRLRRMADLKLQAKENRESLTVRS